jgi:serralysin
VSLPTGGTVLTPIPSGVTALLEPLEFFVKNVKPGSAIEAELFIPDNFNEQTDAYMRFNYQTKRFEEYVDTNGNKLYQLLDENADGKVDRVVFQLTDGDPQWDGDGVANGIIADPGSPIDAQLDFKGNKKVDKITGNLLANRIRGKAGNDQIDGGLGRDIIKGGKGKDKITGGEHGDLLKGGHDRDRYVYHSAADSSAVNLFQQDRILGFAKQDRIDLRQFDANFNETGLQSFQFISENPFSGSPGELRFAGKLLSGDLDGDRMADFAISVAGRISANQLLL